MFILDYVCGLGHSVERTQRVRKGPQRVSEWLKGFLSEDIVKRFRFFFFVDKAETHRLDFGAI